MITQSKPRIPELAVNVRDNFVHVDLDKLDLDYRPNVIYPKWEPKIELPPYTALKKLIIDIETLGLDPSCHRITFIGLMLYSDGEPETIVITDPDEKVLLNEFFSYIKTFFNKGYVVVGHNHVAFDLPFIITRAYLNGINTFNSFHVSERGKNITSASFYGKPIEYKPVVSPYFDIVDTLHLAAIWDKTFAKLTSYTLKQVPIQLGLRKEQRLELSYQELVDKWHSGDHEPIEKYLIYDLEDTKLLADKFLPVVWYQKRILPELSVTQLAISSPAYKAQKIYESLPINNNGHVADERHSYLGGLSECINPGTYRSVAKIDVSSLYPSICLVYGRCSRKDKDKHFLGVLEYMTQARLEVKELAKIDPEMDSYQNSLKVLINGSGYGFLGTSGYSYNCYTNAALITAYGRKILLLMMAAIEECEGTVIEVDTDGVFFASPDNRATFEYIQSKLPEGISIELEIDNAGAYIPLAKNYILFLENGKVTSKGKFRSRKAYKLEKEFPVEFLRRYFKESAESAQEYYQSIINSLQSRTIALSEITVTRRIAANEKEIVKAGIGKVGETVSYWIDCIMPTGRARKVKPRYVNTGEDYWIDYYVERLNEQYQSLIKGVKEFEVYQK